MHADVTQVVTARTTADARPPNPIRNMVNDHVCQVVFIVVAAIVGIAYSVLLPFGFTQRLTWHYLDARYITFSVAFGVATGWMIAVQTYALRHVITRRGAGLGGTGAALGLVPSLLCCSPIVPTLLGLIGLSGASLARASGRTQYFFETKQNLILLASLALVVVADMWATRRVVRARCFNTTGCLAHDATSQPQGSNT
jgi:hypothetical protein